MLTAIAFYLFSTVLILSALMVVSSKNPVNSVLFLILSFFNAAALFVLLGAEFLAMILVVVYVGAVAVLFLFVVMMLDVDFEELKKGVLQNLPLGALIGAALISELILMGHFWGNTASLESLPHTTHVTNTAAIGQVLYTQYLFYFQTAGAILLVAMIGAIVLTLRHRPGVRRQSISRQTARTPAMSVELHDVKPGQGA